MNEDKKSKYKEKIKKLVSNYKKERDDNLDGWKRAKAELINYKKNEEKRVNDRTKKEKEYIILKIIEILDNFDRAENETGDRKDDNLIYGFLKIKEQVEKFLAEEGVEKIDTKNKEFNPYYHEAIETVEDETKESGYIYEEVQKGYLLNKEIIRPAKVKVVK